MDDHKRLFGGFCLGLALWVLRFSNTGSYESFMITGLLSAVAAWGLLP